MKTLVYNDSRAALMYCTGIGLVTGGLQVQIPGTDHRLVAPLSKADNTQLETRKTLRPPPSRSLPPYGDVLIDR